MLRSVVVGLVCGEQIGELAETRGRLGASGLCCAVEAFLGRIGDLVGDVNGGHVGAFFSEFAKNGKFMLWQFFDAA